jgi:hypothetical protein
MSQKIELYSAKLPIELNELADKMKDSGTSVIEVKIEIKSWVKEPMRFKLMDNINKIYTHPKSGRVAKLRKEVVCYAMEKIISNGEEISLPQLIRAISSDMDSAGMENYRVKVLRVIFNSRGQTFRFDYHPPAKANVLKMVGSVGIGKADKDWIDSLIGDDGPLSFCAPSMCTKTYKEVWECR